MRDKANTYFLKFGLVLLLIAIAMLFIVSPGTAEWFISWITFGILLLFDLVLGIYVFVTARKERKDG
jgi:hypothetical protein